MEFCGAIALWTVRTVRHIIRISRPRRKSYARLHYLHFGISTHISICSGTFCQDNEKKDIKLKNEPAWTGVVVSASEDEDPKCYRQQSKTKGDPRGSERLTTQDGTRVGDGWGRRAAAR